MEINTKFNICDIVHGMANNKLFTTEIKGVHVHVQVENVITIKYFTAEGEIPEHRLFDTREELASTIMDGTYNDRVNGH